MTYAHYATMGGFAADIRHLHNTLEQGTLTTKGLLFLADQGYFFEVSSETIADKSKANLLAKVFVCLQVLWVAGQTIERKIAGYPISLLEFHTLVHVFCALVMYTLWIQKPYDVNEPTIISTTIAEDAHAFIVASSRWRWHSGFVLLDPTYGSYGITSWYVNSWVYRLLKTMAEWASDDPLFQYYGALDTSPQIRHRVTPGHLSRINKKSLLRNVDDPRLINHLVAIEDGALITSVIEPDVSYYAGEEVCDQYSPSNSIRSDISLSSGQALRSGLGPSCVLPGPKDIWGITVSLSNKDIYRLDMAGAFIKNILSSADQSEDSRRLLLEEKAYSTAVPFDPFKIKYINRHGTPLIRRREENLSFSGALFRILDDAGLEGGHIWDLFLLVLSLILIPTAYGGIHLSALHEMFPTTIESVLWKVSCFTLIGFTGIFFLSIIMVSGIIELMIWIEEKQKDPKSRLWRWWMRFAIGTITALGLLGSCLLIYAATPLYVFARAFIVVESFISIRHVPIGVYQTPPTNFMGYIPHL
jgi:hypothetical protein